jgi:hypothetical protein
LRSFARLACVSPDRPGADFGHGRAGNQTIVETQPNAFRSGHAGARLDAEAAGFGQATGPAPQATAGAVVWVFAVCAAKGGRRMRPTRPSRRPLAGSRGGKAQVTMTQLPGLVVAVQGSWRNQGAPKSAVADLETFLGPTRTSARSGPRSGLTVETAVASHRCLLAINALAHHFRKGRPLKRKRFWGPAMMFAPHHGL